MSLARQERRRRERQAYKDSRKKNSEAYEMDIKLLQPWSVPVLATKLPNPILGKMLEISDEILDDSKQQQSWGSNLAGQIKSEFLVPHEKLYEAGIMHFFMDTIRQFIIQCKCQMNPWKEEDVHAETWMTQMLSMWIVSQYPNEYNPMHLHTQCHVSSVMYLKVPKFEPAIKSHRSDDDGSILFVNSAGRDVELSTPNFHVSPKVGDYYIFGAHQQHAVYPYRCSEGDPDRRSVSFNAIYKSKTEYEQGLQNEKNNS